MILPATTNQENTVEENSKPHQLKLVLNDMSNETREEKPWERHANWSLLSDEEKREAASKIETGKYLRKGRQSQRVRDIVDENSPNVKEKVKSSKKSKSDNNYHGDPGNLPTYDEDFMERCYNNIVYKVAKIEEVFQNLEIWEKISPEFAKGKFLEALFADYFVSEEGLSTQDLEWDPNSHAPGRDIVNLSVKAITEKNGLLSFSGARTQKTPSLKEKIEDHNQMNFSHVFGGKYDKGELSLFLIPSFYLKMPSEENWEKRPSGENKNIYHSSNEFGVSFTISESLSSQIWYRKIKTSLPGVILWA